MIYILMGVSGSGKTTLGRMLSEKTNIPFYDGDDFHPASNVEKMKSGVPLTDEDRRPWLESISSKLSTWDIEGDAILACSALKESYRNIIATASVPIRWIMLDGSQEVIAERIGRRLGHFFDPNLLKSQFETLEIPADAWHFNINASPEAIAEQIAARIMKSRNRSDIGLVGLGVMGGNLALNIAGHVRSISVYNRQVTGTEEDVAINFVNDNPTFDNLVGFDSIEPFIRSIRQPRSILIMVNAGQAVDSVIQQLLPHLDSGDCIVDCGNSHYEDTSRRESMLSKQKIKYIGMGVSGGEKGARNGPSLMPGGAPEAFGRLSGILNAIAARDSAGNPCCSYIGKGGSGHFVKMIHNGIEYAEMQLIAECFDLLLASGLNYSEIADIFEEWHSTPQKSYLLEITVDILRTTSEVRHVIDCIKDIASHKGTGSWSVHAGLDLHTPSASIYSALSARQYSSLFDLRKVLSESYGTGTGANIAVPELLEAYAASRLLNHVIGFEIIRTASSQMRWDINMSELARIWTNGCIIRSGLMEEFVGIFKEPGRHLLQANSIKQKLTVSTPSMRSIISSAVRAELSIPVMMSCLSYFDAMRRTNTGARLIAAQRDYFGAHGLFYSDDDTNTLHHVNWPSGQMM